MPDEIQDLASVDAPVPNPAPSRPRLLVFRIFVGPCGVRAGWKVFIYFVVFAALGFGLRPILKLLPAFDPKAPIPPTPAFVNEFLTMAVVLISTAIMAKWIDKKPLGYFGVPLRSALGSSFWIGAASGLGALALQLQLMHLFGWFDFGVVQLHGSAVVGYGLFWALVFLCVGVTEEGLLRGYVQRATTDGLRKLSPRWSFWISAVLFSLLFGAGHLGNPGENKFGIVMVFADGMAMCFSLWRTGNLWFAIGNHAAWDWGETFLFGTPNSGFRGQHVLMHPAFHGPALLAGGTDGPEGSVLALLSEALFIVMIAVLYPRRRYALLNDDSPLKAE
jgi:membrane protease YdiL (CAAX protease family)